MKPLIALSCCCFIAISCSRPVEPPPIEKVFPPVSSLQQAREKADAVDFNLDGTLSMQGFATASDGKFFSQLLQDLDRALTSEWTAEKIAYYRFGSDRELIATQKFYVDASNPNFFKGKQSSQETKIENAFRACKERLCLVMTDLFEQDFDITSIKQALTSAGYPDRSSLAIWQWKMPFDGLIFDYDIRIREGRPYKGDRNLYMLALGPKESIEKLRAALSEKQTAGTASPRYLLLSNDFVVKSPDWLTVVQSQNLARISRFAGDRAAEPYLVYQVSNNCSSAELTTTSHIDVKPDGTAGLSAPGSYQASLFALSNSKDVWTYRELQSPAVSAAPKNSVHFKVNCSDLAGSRISLLRISRMWSGQDMQMLNWVDESSSTSMDYKDPEKMKRADWGAKTLNLSPFVKDLATTATDGKIMATAYIYLVTN